MISPDGQEYDPNIEGVFRVPDTVDFGERDIDRLTDDEFMKKLMTFMSHPVSRNVISEFTAGGPAVRPLDEFGEL